MKAVFIESSEFTEWVKTYLTDEALSALQRDLINDPVSGAVMPGCGGLRKLRIADASRGKGKRGGARVIYLHVPEVHQFYMLDVYGKDEEDDLSPQEKRFLAARADQLRREAKASSRRKSGGRKQP